MAATSERADGADGEAGLPEPDHSGTRLRPDEGEVELLDAEELEMVEVVLAPRRARVPPPPPRRATPERIDLDALISKVPQPAPLAEIDAASLPSAPTPVEALLAEPSPPSRPQWGIAIVVATTAIVAGGVTALVFMLTSSEPAPAAPPVSEERAVELVIDRRAEETRTPERAELAAPSATRESSEGAEASRAHAAEARGAVEQARTTRAAGAKGAARVERTSTTRAAEARGAAPARRSRQTQASPSRAARAERPSATRGAAPAERPSAAGASAVEERAPSPTEPSPTAEASPTTEASAAPAPEAPVGPLPERPSRADVESAVQSVLPALRACGSGVGVVVLELHFASSGRATTAQVDARLLTPAQRSCLARAARAARVPPFSASHLSVHYPIRL